MMLIPSFTFAQFDQTIGTGTDNYYLAPFCTSNNYSWSETIYPSTEFPGAVYINSLSWYSDVVEQLTCSSIRIYLAQKTGNVFSSTSDWTPQSQMTLVYEGTNVVLGQTSGWETFTLNDPYYYDGNGNLVVIVAKSCTTPDGSTRYRYSTVENTFLYRQSASTAAYASYSSSYAGTLSSYRANLKVNYNLDNAVAVDNIQVSVSGRNANVTWDAPILEEPVGYKVEYKMAGTDNWILADNNVTGTSYTIHGLYFLKDYIVRITPNGVSEPGAKTKGFATGCLSGESYEFDVAIGNGTTTSSYLPAYSLYNHSLTEQIYRAEELQGEGTITSLTFQASEVPTTPRQMAFYLMPTTQSSVTSFVNLDASAVEVFSGSVPLAVGDNVITFSTPFEYDGTSNLMLVVTEDQTWSSSNYFYVHTNGSNNSCYVYNDDSAYNPNQASSYSGYSTTTNRNNIVFHFEANTCDTTDNLRVLNLDVVTHGRTADVTWDMYEGAGFESVTGYKVEYKTNSASEWIVAAENTPNTFLSIGNLYYLPVYTVRVTPVGAAEAIGAMTDFQLECQNEVPVTPTGFEGDIAIGDASETTYVIPVNNFYKYSYSQEIFLANELNGAGNITSIAYNYSYSSPLTNKTDVKIYLAHTSKTSFTSALDYVPASDFQLVYQGDLNCSQGWNTFTFTTPFEYNGTDNLVVMVDDNSGSYDGSSWTFYGHSTSDCKAISYYSDTYYPGINSPDASSAYSTMSYTRNDTRFTFTGGSPAFECDTAGNLRVQNLTVTTNRRTAVATWDPATGDGAEDITGYKVEIKTTTDAEWTLATPNTPNTTWTFNNLYFEPTYQVRVTPVGSNDAGPMTEQFQLECPNVIVTTVDEDVTCGNSTSNAPYLPLNNYYNYSYSQQIYLANEINVTGLISSIAYQYYYSSPTTVKNDVDIYMAHTNKSSFSSYTDYIPASQFQLVYHGPLNCTQGWNTFTLNTPFDYNGVDNLVVMVDDNSGTYNGSGYYFNTTATSGNTSLYYYQDGGDINPSSPSAVNYGTVQNRVNTRFHFGYDGYTCDTVFCHSVQNLTVAGVNDHRATLAWTRGDQENNWDVILSETEITPDINSTPTQTVYGNPSCILGNLNHSTTYHAYVRANCGGEDGVSPWSHISFRTTQVLATVPYNCDFEDAEADNWALVNGNVANQWVIGNATGNTGRSLYISQDQGTTNTYDGYSSSMVFAYRDVEFPANEDGYQISFDWKCQGESGYDFANLYLCVQDDPVAGDGSDVVIPAHEPLLPSLLQGSSTFQTLTLTLPGYSTPTVKRILFLWNNDSSVGNNPPAAIDNFRITMSTCIAPENLTAHNITYKQAELSWAPGDATQWDVYYTTSSDQPAADVVPQYVGINTLPLTITGLDENTTYYAYVRTNCGNEVSVWAPVTFTTQCSAVSGIPYSENFDNTAVSDVPSCWTRFSTNEGTEYPYVSTTQHASGSSALYFYNPYSTSAYNYSYAATEAIDMSTYPSNSLLVTFKSLTTNEDYGDVRVGIMTDPNDVSTFSTLMSLSSTDYENVDTWYEREVVIPNHYDEPVYLAFMTPAVDYSTFYIDDVEINPMPTCSDLTNLTVTDFAGTSAKVTWDAAPYGNHPYILEYKESESATWNPAITLSETYYMLSGLDIETSYDVRVTTDCATATEQTISFTTACLNGVGGGINEGSPEPVAGGPMPEVTIGEGTSINYNLPTNTLYKYSVVEQIYLASEIGESGTINSISFPYSGGDAVSRNVNVYLVHTTRSSFTSNTNWILPSSSDLVYSGTMSCLGSDPRLTITLTTPFEYDGTSNLALIMQDNTGSWSTRYFYTYPTGSNRALYVCQNASSYSINSLSSYTGTTSTDNSQIIFNFGNTSGSGSGTTPSTGVPETVTIGTGTTQKQYLPAHAFYYYAYSQQVYLASELGGAGTINSVAFNCASNGGVSRNYTVYLMPTTQNSTSESWVTYYNAQQVFSGYVNINNGWNTITFTTPYEYDGTSNLVLMVDDNTGSYTPDYPYFYCSSITGTSSACYDDENNPNPANISAYPYGVEWAGSYRMNTQFNITRTGGGGGSTPASSTEVTEIEIGTGTNTSNNFPSNSCYKYSYSQQIYTAAELGEAGSITAIAFNCNSLASTSSPNVNRNLTIYLMPTTQTSTNSSFLPFVNAQQVYSGMLNTVTGWNTITFNTPYEYDGVSNVAVLIDDNTGAFSCSNYYYVSTITGTSSSAFSDSYNPVPSSMSSYSGSMTYPNSRMNAKFTIERATPSECNNDLTQCVAPNAYLEGGRETDFTMAWAAGNAETEWEVYLTHNTTAPTDETSATDYANMESFNFTNLQPSTTYYAYVRSICGTDDRSEWAGPVEYTTPAYCPAQTLPYEENFSDYAAAAVTYDVEGVAPDCWLMICDGTDETYMPKVSNYSTYVPECGTTSEYLMMSVSTANAAVSTSQIAALPLLAADPGHISFNARITNYHNSILTLGYVMPDNSFTALMQVNTNYLCGQVFDYSFCGKKLPAGARLAFKFAAVNSEYASGIDYAMIDNIEVSVDGGTITDYDGNIYNVAQIGSNCWMTENMKSTHYSNGVAVDGVFDYENNPSNATTYGKLYTWYAAANLPEGGDATVTNPHQGVCPAGWHIPTVADYAELIALSGDNAANLKSNANSDYWLGQFGGATPGIGFDAVPAGFYDGNFNNILGEAYFWTTENVTVTMNKALCLLYYCPESFWKDIDHHYGLSIRCVRD